MLSAKQNRVQSLYKAMIGVLKNGPYYEKGPFYTRIVGKNDHFTVISMAVHGHFSIISLQNMMVKRFGSHKMTISYPNICYNEMCYKGIAL